MKKWTPKAELYDFGRPFPEDAVTALIDSSVLPSDSCIDVFEPGCGTGRVLIPIAKKFSNWKYYGIDSSQGMLDVFQSRIEKYNLLNVQVREGLLPDNIPDKKFDLIIHSSVLHAVKDWQSALNCLTQKLSNNGMFCLISDHGDLYDEALGRTCSQKNDESLHKFWQLYLQIRKDVGAPSTEASQVGAKWDLESTDVASYLLSNNFSEIKRVEHRWVETLDKSYLTKIIQERCYSSMFTVDDDIYTNLLNQFLAESKNLELKEQMKSNHIAVARYFIKNY